MILFNSKKNFIVILMAVIRTAFNYIFALGALVMINCMALWVKYSRKSEIGRKINSTVFQVYKNFCERNHNLKEIERMKERQPGTRYYHDVSWMNVTGLVLILESVFDSSHRYVQLFEKRLERYALNERANSLVKYISGAAIHIWKSVKQSRCASFAWAFIICFFLCFGIDLESSIYSSSDDEGLVSPLTAASSPIENHLIHDEEDMMLSEDDIALLGSIPSDLKAALLVPPSSAASRAGRGIDKTTNLSPPQVPELMDDGDVVPVISIVEDGRC